MRQRTCNALDAAVASLLLVTQAVAVAPLFAGQTTRWRESVEGAFVAEGRFLLERFPHLSWDPLWYLGFPFELAYPPLVPLLVASIARVTSDPLGAYRLVAALGFTLGAPALYFVARALALSRPASTLAAVLFAAGPAPSFLDPDLLRTGPQIHGLVGFPARLQALVEFGEGPHVLGLTLALFATAALVAAMGRPTGARVALAVALAAATALANLVAVTAFAVLALGALLTALGDPGRARAWLRIIATSAALALVWYSPGAIAAALTLGPAPDRPDAVPALALAPVLLGAALVASFRVSRDPRARVLAFWLVLFGGAVAAWELGRLLVVPQAYRLVLETDAALALAAAALAERGAARLGARRGSALAVLAAGLALASVPSWSTVREAIAPEDPRAWSEREVALWLREHLGPAERAFLSGDHALWLDAFADVPQVRGGSDFAATDPWWAHATFQIRSGTDADVSVLWLRALGVRYAVVTGPDSTDRYRDFARPELFDGRLVLATTIQGARVYEVPAPRAAPLLVARRDDLAPPRDALDRVALERYLRALDDGVPGARLVLARESDEAWSGSASTERGATLLLRVAHDTGWRATVNGSAAATRPDAVGLLAVDLPSGDVSLRVEHGPHADLIVAQGIALAVLLVPLARRALRSARAASRSQRRGPS